MQQLIRNTAYIISIFFLISSCSQNKRIYVGEFVPDYNVHSSIVELKDYPSDRNGKSIVSGKFSAKIFKDKIFVVEPLSFGTISFFNTR